MNGRESKGKEKQGLLWKSGATYGKGTEEHFSDLLWKSLESLRNGTAKIDFATRRNRRERKAL